MGFAPRPGTFVGTAVPSPSTGASRATRVGVASTVRMVTVWVVATWGRFEHEVPDMAAAGRRLWQEHGLMYLATVRLDGRPRLHPVAPFLALDTLVVAISHRSPKWRDLGRDPRCVLHCLPGDRDDEFSLQCRAMPVSDQR